MSRGIGKRTNIAPIPRDNLTYAIILVVIEPIYVLGQWEVRPDATFDKQHVPHRLGININAEYERTPHTEAR